MNIFIRKKLENTFHQHILIISRFDSFKRKSESTYPVFFFLGNARAVAILLVIA